VLLLLLTLLTLGRFERRTGGVFLLGIALWAVARAIVASTWRDPAVAGSLNMGQVIAIAVAAGMLALLLVNVVATSRRAEAPDAAEPAQAEPEVDPSAPTWADPTTRPRI
jgi:hypothetical protein